MSQKSSDIKNSPMGFAVKKLGKKRTPRQRINLALPAIKFFGSKNADKRKSGDSNQKSNSSRMKNIQSIIEKLYRPLLLACEKFELDENNERDRLWALLWLAWSLYGGVAPGRPKKWVTSSAQKLLDAVDRVQKGQPHLNTEVKICRELCEGKMKLPEYIGLKPASLRRKLQDAKKLQALDHREAKFEKTILKSIWAKA